MYENKSTKNDVLKFPLGEYPWTFSAFRPWSLKEAFMYYGVLSMVQKASLRLNMSYVFELLSDPLV